MERLAVPATEVLPFDVLDEGLLVREIEFDGGVTLWAGHGEPVVVDVIDGKDVWGVQWTGDLSPTRFDDPKQEVVVMRGVVMAQARSRGYEPIANR